MYLLKTEEHKDWKRNIWKKMRRYHQNMSIMCPIYKKEKHYGMSNYRGISFLNTPYKVLSNVLLNKLMSYVW